MSGPKTFAATSTHRGPPAAIPEPHLESTGDLALSRTAPTSIATEKRVTVTPMLDLLREAVEAHPAIQWHEKMAELLGCCGTVLQYDIDGAVQVQFVGPVSCRAWLPVSTLDGFRIVKVDSRGLQENCEEVGLEFLDALLDLGIGREMVVDQDDGTTQVYFETGDMAWLPTANVYSDESH